MMKRTLFRNPTQGKIAGVCAGIADYCYIEAWLVRIITLSLFLFGGYLWVPLAYVGLTLFLEKKPLCFEEDKPYHLKQKSWQQGKSASSLLKELELDFQKIEKSVDKMESYVTSHEFKVRRAFSDLK